MFAEVFINLPVKSIAQSFTYFIPEELEWLTKGCRVVVPFGHRLIEGFVVDIKQEIPENLDLGKIKKIHSALDQEPWFTEKMYDTALWMRNYYLCSLGEAMRLFIPGKNSVKINTNYYLNAQVNINLLNEQEQRILSCFAGGKIHSFISLRKLLPEFKYLNHLLNNLVEYGYLSIQEEVKQRAKEIYLRLYTINMEKIKACLLDNDFTTFINEGFKRLPAQRKAILFFFEHPEEKFTLENLKKENISADTVKKLLKEDYIKEMKEVQYRNSYYVKQDLVIPERILTPEQRVVVENILNADEEQPFLLYGITGSGKTQVYIELVKHLPKGKQAVILVPEIVLTAQLVRSLQEYFPQEVAVIHSRLTINERHDTFNRIRRGQAKVIIGARSALFAPFKDLSLIIMDEEHDPSYKQEEAPRYHTRDLAIAMGKIYKAKVLLASATPSLESFYLAQKGEYRLNTMLNRVDNIPLPKIEAVDMRQELHYGNRKILSHALQDLIRKNLEQQQQTIIMLNRRGYATFVMCRSCGYVAKCTECTMPMVYHRRNILQCHHCDITAPVPTVCLECGSKYIKFFGSGTEKLEQELEVLFPEAKVLRLDRDTTGKKFAHQEILNKFRSGDYDILLGTQMVAKGHDIQNVTAVGIISADSSINIPEFRAGERCFSLITQTAGRAGRGNLPGKVIVQAYSMEHYALTWGIKQDYQGFYQEELPMRQILFFPPFAYLIKLICTSDNEKEAMALGEKIKGEFLEFKKEQSIRCEIMGPAPALRSYLRGQYRYNLLLKSEKIEVLQEFIRRYKLDIDSKVIIDVNPMNTN